ncbi:MAG: DUF72 domain-containing protein [Myxococcales bacterium]|nr:DUF72 domain-containing protein [Myxococcales bacterium]MCB9579079.1 DUF72 domain-containing protein [Polyangiaceae bacterium]
MRVRAGTSGFSYAGWKGSFYPEDCAASDMLAFYAGKLSTVEINNTFYRMPKADVVHGWREQVPPDFRFSLKASRRITHFSKLRDVADSVAVLFKVSAILEDRLGAMLFQLPPFLKRDVPLLRDFLATLPHGCHAALEFRHESWFADDVFAVLSEKNAALVTGDAEKADKSPPFVATASFGYLRLRSEDYSDAAIGEWAERISAQRWSEAFAFFKHEDKGPAFAARLGELTEKPGVARAKGHKPSLSKPRSPAKKRQKSG